jgi:hypothetical protein
MASWDENNGLRGLKLLVGLTINKIEVDDDGQSYLRFWTNSGMMTYQADGDCCSESWFADMIGVQALIGGTVAAVAELPLPNYNVDDGRGRQDSDQAYGYQIITDKGSCDVIFRNSSNGYYGGDIFLMTEDQLNGHNGYNLIPHTWVDIAEDWSAK